MRPPRTIRDLAEHALAPAAARRVILCAAGDPSRERTGGSLLRDAAALARRLGQAGMVSGDLALLEGLTGESFVTACLAVWERDAMVLPADASAAPGELALLRGAFRPRWRLRRGDGPGGLSHEELELGQASGGDVPVPGPSAGMAMIKMTSGSTGRPRGVAVMADQLLADGRHIIEGMGLRPDDLNVAAIPLSHSYGQGSLLMPLLMQGTAMILADPRHPDSLARALSGEMSLAFPGVPALFGMLGRRDGPAITRRGLRLCLSAGALLPPSSARAFRERTGVPVRAFYGTSETGGICFDASAAGDAAEEIEGAVGSALPGVDVSLDPATGRVVVRSDAVAIGYIAPESPDAAEDEAPGRFVDGAFHTGDTGCWLAPRAVARSLRLTGRVGELVNVAGRKVDPVEVERVLRQVIGVHDAVVIGVPDAVRGESVAACLEADPGVTRESVMERLRAELAPHKLPRRLVFLEQLPRNERGKTDKDALRRALRDDMSEASG